MKYGRYGLSYLFLRLGLGFVFLWIGIDIFRHPEAWIGFIPDPFPFGLSREVGRQISGLFDIALGVFLLVRAWPKLTALLAVIHMVGILIVHGIDAVLIRDVGLLSASVALFFWPYHYKKRRFTRLLSRSRPPAEEEV